MKNNESHVYADLEVLSNWSSKMSEINEYAIMDLNALVSAVKEIDDYWSGNIANGFLRDSEELIQKAKLHHNQMKDLPKLLSEVVNKMNYQ